MKHNISMIRAEQFYSSEAAQQINNATLLNERTPTDYGSEIQGIQLIEPGLEDIFSAILGEDVILDEETSGKIRTTMRTIHFETFSSLNDWCFAVALEPVTFNTYFHLSGAETALQEVRFNYKNLFDWDYNTNILLKPGQGIFYRPWLFHNFDGGNILYFKLKSTKSHIEMKRRILVMGENTPLRNQLASELSEALSATKIQSSEVRKSFQDTDYSFQGHVAQAKRLHKITSVVPTKLAVVEYLCPIQQSRDFLKPDFIIWVKGNDSSKFEAFEDPPNPDFIVSNKYDINDLIVEIKQKLLLSEET